MVSPVTIRPGLDLLEVLLPRLLPRKRDFVAGVVEVEDGLSLWEPLINAILLVSLRMIIPSKVGLGSAGGGGGSSFSGGGGGGSGFAGGGGGGSFHSSRSGRKRFFLPIIAY